MTRVYADMVADLFHYGHVEFLRRAREVGDVLIIGIHSDETVGSYKRAPVMTMLERVRVVEACRYVDEVVPDAPLSVTRDWIERHRIDVVVHGDDLDREETASMYEIPAAMGILRTVPYTAGISTSEILRRLDARLGAGPDAAGR
jgi:ethanolamine-phosphate cytidylyltransferase/choline-phosphate cytidylyltransferase